MTPEQYITRVKDLYERAEYVQLFELLREHADEMSPQLDADAIARVESMAKIADNILDPHGQIALNAAVGDVRIIYPKVPVTSSPVGGYRFDFAISFAGSQRETARQIRTALREAGFAVFIDEDYEHEMIGIDAGKYLRNVYTRESHYCIVLISRDYDVWHWTELERESIQSHELRGEREVLIPVITETIRPAWLPESRIYFDLSRRSIAGLAAVLARLGELAVRGPSSGQPLER